MLKVSFAMMFHVWKLVTSDSVFFETLFIKTYKQGQIEPGNVM